MKAFLLQDMSCSPSRNLAISSGASGIKESWFLFIINKCHNLLTWNYAIILTQTQYTFILNKKQTSHDWDGDHLMGDGDYLKGPWLNEGHWDGKHSEDLALTCDLEIQFKINAHPLTKGTLLGKYGPDWTDRRKYGLHKWCWTDIQFTTEHPHCGPLYNY